MRLIDFIPLKWRQWLAGTYMPSNSYLLGQEGPIWLNVDKPRLLYNTIPQLRLVVRRDAAMFSNMEPMHINKDGNPVENSPYLERLKQPNAVQSMQQFLRQYDEQLLIYGNQFIYKNQTLDPKLQKVPISLRNISPQYLQPVLTGKVFDQIELKEMVKEYQWQFKGGKQTFAVDKILWSKEDDLDNDLVGESPLMALKYPLSNIEAAYGFRNVIMTKKGAIGVLSNESSDGSGGIPMDDQEKQEIYEKHVDTYGISPHQRSIILTNAKLRWQHMSFPTREMMLFEEVDANMITICDTFGHNINIYSTRNSTYENTKNAIIQTYESAIFPRADQFMQNMSKFLLMPPGERLVASYAHLEIMKENRLKGMAAIEAIVRSLTQAVAMGIMQAPQATRILATELDLTAEV